MYVADQLPRNLYNKKAGKRQSKSGIDFQLAEKEARGNRKLNTENLSPHISQLRPCETSIKKRII